MFVGIIQAHYCVIYSAAAEVTKSDKYPYRKGNK